MERAEVSKHGITFGADNSQMESSTVPVTPVKVTSAASRDCVVYRLNSGIPLLFVEQCHVLSTTSCFPFN